MNDYDRQHTPSRCVFFARYLSKQSKSMAKDPATINPQSPMVNGFRRLNPLLLKAAEIGTFDGPYSEERYRSSL